jgi:hypothetical protein
MPEEAYASPADVQKSRWTLCLAALLLSFAATLISHYAQAQSPESNQASLVIHSDQPQGIINRNICGRFAKHLGRLI